MIKNLTLEEASELTGLSVSYLKEKFKTAQRTLAKRGVIIDKEGRGKSATYTIDNVLIKHAETFLQEEEKLLPHTYRNVLNTTTLEYVAFLGIGTTPNLSINGSYKDFLKYLEMNPSKENVEAIKKALESLAEQRLIRYYPDDTNEDWFLAGFSWRIYQECSIKLSKLKELIEISRAEGKKSWVPLVKTFGAEVYLTEIKGENPIRKQDIIDATGLSENAVTDSVKILEKYGYIMTKIKNIRTEAGDFRCKGKETYISGIYDSESGRRTIGEIDFKIQ